MIKNYLLMVFFAVSVISFAQIPTGYYDGTSGLKGETLKNKLSQIINNGAIDTGYNWATVNACDIDKYYENDNSILDIYSENPLGVDPYVYQPGTDQGSSGAEGCCYNREHIFPQGYFNGASPMVSDYHHILATDTQVNNRRGNFPFGNVGTASWTSKNGSKLGTSSSPDFFGTVFEPINEFKGDVARFIFYFATRYQSNLSGFDQNDILTNTSYPGIQDWELKVLLSWSSNDPVSQKEIDRNNCVYNKQKNRNPYIDNPNWVTAVFDPNNYMATVENTLSNFSINPNPVKNNQLFVTGKNLERINRIEIYNTTGQLVQVAERPFSNKNYIQLRNLLNGLYFMKIENNSYKFLVE